MFGFISKLRFQLAIPTPEDRERAYLNEASDRIDLEHRQRQIDRGLFRRRNNANWM